MIARSVAVAMMISAVVVATPATAQFTYDGYPWLGIIMGGAEGGVLVQEVVPGTPAEQAGLAAGDVVTSVAGEATKDSQKLVGTMKQQRVGDVVDIELRRGERRLTVVATLVSKPDLDQIRRTRLIDRIAPRFNLDVVSGAGSGSLVDYDGKVIVFVSWAPLDCAGCDRLFARLEALYERHGTDRMIVLVAAADVNHRVQAALKQRPLPFTVLADPMGVVRDRYDIMSNRRSDPVAVVIDRQGFVREVAFRSSRINSIAAEATRLLGETPAP